MERNITLNGRPGREFRIDLDAGPVLTERVFCDAAKKRVFDVGIIVPKTPDSEQHTSNFLNSFRFLWPGDSESPWRGLPADRLRRGLVECGDHCGEVDLLYIHNVYIRRLCSMA
jgi:hypothetical protein